MQIVLTPENLAYENPIEDTYPIPPTQGKNFALSVGSKENSLEV
jgi:hypothetical protein